MNCQHCNSATVLGKQYCQHCINNMCLRCKKIVPNSEERHEINTIIKIEPILFYCSPCNEFYINYYASS